MPTNTTDAVCHGCGAGPGARHTASCPQVGRLEVHEDSARITSHRFIHDPAQVESPYLAPDVVQQRTLAALESIAMSLDAIAKHLLSPVFVVDPAQLGDPGPLTPGRAVRLTPEGSAQPGSGQEPPEERS